MLFLNTNYVQSIQSDKKPATKNPNKTGTNHYKKGMLSEKDFRGLLKEKTLLVTPLAFKFCQYLELWSLGFF